LQDAFRAHYITGMEALPIAQRKALKARAHRLDPVVQIGGQGVTPAVLAEIGRALAAHELIKVRAGAMDRHSREAALAEICRRCGASPVQHVGKVLVLYKAKEGES
jgi:putative YhbY family RNA-binding protein